jgi:hypothetical protein
MIGADKKKKKYDLNINNNSNESNSSNNKNKSLLNVSISNLHISSKGTQYVAVLTATLIVSLTISGGFSSTSSTVYAVEQTYSTQGALRDPLLPTSFSAMDQQENQQLQQQPTTNNQTGMEQLLPSSAQNDTTHAFEDAFLGIVNDTRNLSLAYQNEIADLQAGVYDNQTFVMITNLYLPLYQQLIDRANALNQSAATLPQNYSKAIDLYSESIENEMMSQEHLRNYLSTGDPAENEKSLGLLSDSLRLELESLAAFSSVSNIPNPFQNFTMENMTNNNNTSTATAMPGT